MFQLWEFINQQAGGRLKNRRNTEQFVWQMLEIQRKKILYGETS